MPSARPRDFRWILPAAGLACLVVGLLVVGAFDPAVSGWYPPCLFHRWTGLNCPGCGSTRALHQLLHGHIGAALRLNAFAVLAIPFLTYWAARQVGMPAGRRLPALPVPGAVAWGLVAGVIGFWVLRNIPAWPFTWLAP
jgi:hypothetical protein